MEFYILPIGKISSYFEAGDEFQVIGRIKSTQNVKKIDFYLKSSGSTFATLTLEKSPISKANSFGNFNLRENLPSSSTHYMTLTVSATITKKDNSTETLGGSDTINFLGHRVNPVITDCEFTRCDESGNDDMQGAYARLINLTITTEAGRSSELTDLSVSISPAPGGGSASSFTPGGYSGSSKPTSYSDSGTPSSSGWFLGSRTFLERTEYSVTLTVTSGPERSSYTAVISPAFAKLHISGNRTGGVAIGQFSTSYQEDAYGNPIDGIPKFEVAPDHTTYLYGPTYIEGVRITPETCENDATVETGWRWLNGKKIYRYVYDGIKMQGSYLDDWDNMDEVISIHGTAHRSDGQWVPFPSTRRDGFLIPYIDAQGNLMTNITDTSGTYDNVIVIIYFTKVIES